MNYHGKIMNIPCDAGAGSLAYNIGHRDGRHAAAEIALNADQEIARLRAEIKQLRSAQKDMD